MVRVTDAELTAHADRARGKVVLITGGAQGIGKETVLLFARHGAKIVIGDIAADVARATVEEVVALGGEAVSQRCDVTVWEDQVALFELAKNTFGSVDIVIPNAGIGETNIIPLQSVNGKPQRPDIRTVNVNLIGVIYSTSLALHYLVPDGERARPGDLKALVLVSSMSAVTPLYTAVLYTASKHGVLGLQRSIGPQCTAKGIRVGCVCPFFVETGLLSGLEEFIDGLPLVPVRRVAKTLLAVATNPDPNTSEKQWLLPDDGEAERLDVAILDEGCYKLLNTRFKEHAETGMSLGAKMTNPNLVINGVH